MELLVVIAIIIILVGLVIVGLTRATESARETKALVPLRTAAAAGMVYSVENNGQINTLKWPEDPLEGGGGAWVSNSFWGRLQPHIFTNITSTTQTKLGAEFKQKIGELFPTTNPSKMTGTLMQGGSIYHDASGLPVPFAFNRYLYKWNNRVTVNEAGGPTGIIYMTYGWHLFDEKDASAYVEWPKDGTTPKNPIRYLSNQKVMAVYLDGHVEMLAPPIPKRLFHQDFADSPD